MPGRAGRTRAACGPERGKPGRQRDERRAQREGGLWRERPGDRVGAAEQRARGQVRGERERQLRRKPGVDRGLEDGMGGQAGEDALEQLLDEEGDRRQQRERPGGGPSLEPAGDAERQRQRDERRADGEELRRVAEVAVDAGVPAARADEGIARCVTGQAAGRGERKRKSEERALPHAGSVRERR